MLPERLTKGYRAFLEGRFAVERGRYQTLAGTGQSPTIMVIGCVDSRVSPEVIFDAAPGEILVARNVANLVPAYEPPSEEDPSHQHGTSAALEFAVRALKVRDIIVLGHAFCGGVKAFADDAAPLTDSDFIGKWVRQIAPAAVGSLRQLSPWGRGVQKARRGICASWSSPRSNCRCAT
jgi:carbonic anhydrase